MITMGSDLEPGRLADRLVAVLSQPEINPQAYKLKRKAVYFDDEGIEKQIENSLDATKKVASQRNPGNKVRKRVILAALRMNLFSTAEYS
eukprot:1160285-Pelagomonas_calceolata.AAC.8